VNNFKDSTPPAADHGTVTLADVVAAINGMQNAIQSSINEMRATIQSSINEMRAEHGILLRSISSNLPYVQVRRASDNISTDSLER
jgi:hypothetical protein